MNRGWESDRHRPNPALSQRQRELLALFAASPPGEKLARFCRRAKIHRDTWHGWRTGNPDFAAELERIRQERVQVALEPLHDAVPLLVESLVKLATGGSIAALRTAGDWLGLSRRATQNVQVAVEARGVAVQEPESLEELLQEHAQLRAFIVRRQERARLVQESAGDQGSTAEGSGVPEPGDDAQRAP